MSNIFTLDSLREETVRRYAPVVVELSDGSSVELKSLLRLRKKDRDEVVEALNALGEYEDDPEDDEDDAVRAWADVATEACGRIYKIIVKGSTKKLLADLDDDDPTIKANLYTALLNHWVSESQLGEAESSPAS